MIEPAAVPAGADASGRRTPVPDVVEDGVDFALVVYREGGVWRVEEISEDDFNKHKIGLINKRLEKLKNLSEESGRLWHHVSSEAFDFDLGKFFWQDSRMMSSKTNNITQSTATSNTSNLSQRPTSNPSTAPTSTPPPKPAPKPPSTSSPKAAAPQHPARTSRSSPRLSRRPWPNWATPMSTRLLSPRACPNSTSQPARQTPRASSLP